VLKGKLFINKEGIWSYGSIETINSSLIEPKINNDKYIISIPSGYLEKEYNHEINIVYPNLDDDNKFITIAEGYINEVNLKLMLNDNIQFISSLNENMINIEIPIYDKDVSIYPSVSSQTIYTSNKYLKDNIVINAVTSKIDNNIKPENIKSGISILGV
jgi:hypothetical protein